MDLFELRPIDFRSRLDGEESQAITIRKRRSNELVRSVKGTIAGGVTLIGGTLLASLAMDTLVVWFGILPALAFFLVAVTAAVALAFVAGGRFLSPPDRRLLPKIVEPEAKYFLEENWSRRERLLAEAAAYNSALEAFKALPERAGEDEIDVGVIVNLAARRLLIENEIDTYLADFRKATEAERKNVLAANVRRKKLISPHRQSLRNFRRKIKKLTRLERSLDALADSIGGEEMVDLAPYLAAQRFRAELEDERAMLIRCGFKPRKLPKQRVAKKLLLSGS